MNIDCTTLDCACEKLCYAYSDKESIARESWQDMMRVMKETSSKRIIHSTSGIDTDQLATSKDELLDLSDCCKL